MSSLNLLVRHLPSWAKILQENKVSVHISAIPPQPSGDGGREYILCLKVSGKGGVEVFEEPAGSLLPKFCVERHINYDSSFCLFLESSNPLKDIKDVEDWWGGLKAFLICQDYAEQSGLWPIGSGLSHGDAAYEQIAMEEIATPLGWLREVELGVVRSKGWLSENLPRASKNFDRVFNRRSPCPRDCTYKHGKLRKRSCDTPNCVEGCQKQHKPILRTDCPHRDAIEGLILHERKRQSIELKMFDTLRRKKFECCGTMKNCPLAKN